MGDWLRDKGSVIGGIAGTIVAFVAILQLFVVSPMNQRFDALERHVDQRFDAQDKYINQRFDAVDQRFDAVEQRLKRLEDDVAELHRLSDRVSRNEGQIDLMREQLQTVDAP